jgi:hypothetical protein
MAQAKTTAKSRSSSAKGSSKRSGGSKNGSRAQSRARSTAKRSTSKNGSRAQTRSKNGSSRAQPRSKSGSSSGSRKQPNAQQSNVAAMAHKAKGPAIAGGAALMGLAGGLAMKNGSKRNGKGLSKKLSIDFPKPKGSAVKILGGAAKEIAKGGYKIGQLTSEVRKVREAVESQND